MTPFDLVLRAETAILEKRFADALPDLRSALDQGLDHDAYPSERGEYVPLPEAALAEMLLGLALLETGEGDAGLVHLDRAVELDRDDHRIRANRGHVRRERGDLAAAIEDLTRAIARRPDYVFARFRRAQCLMTLGQPEGAEADLGVILGMSPHDVLALEMWRESRRLQGKESLAAWDGTRA